MDEWVNETIKLLIDLDIRKEKFLEKIDVLTKERDRLGKLIETTKALLIEKQNSPARIRKLNSHDCKN